jgi:hypothetical protein
LNADQIIGEYVAAAEAMAPHADYLMLNLSCPNTVDGRDFFADAGHLNACLAALGEAKLRPPVFLKVSPLGGVEAIERMLAAADGRDFVSGFMFNLSPVSACARPSISGARCPARCPALRRRRWPISASAKLFGEWIASATS